MDYHLTIASSHHLAASASEKRALALPHLTSRRSVGSWPPELARSAFDAHWPPPEAWYLGIIRVASCGRICPLTCAKARGESVSCACAMKAAIADAVAAAGCPTALSFPPSRHLPTLTPAAPSKHPKIIISPSPLLTTSLPRCTCVFRISVRNLSGSWATTPG
jgi:hypothetical protein